MRRQGAALGLLSIGGQVLLLRELAATLQGDELYIGTALFGWLCMVALGAFIGGRIRHTANTTALFIAGAVILPASMIAIRLSPLSLNDFVGQVIPFSTGVLVSIVAMIPSALLSGWLFSAITRSGRSAADATVSVYLFEGIGSCIGGVAITLCAGKVVSAMTLSFIIGLAALGIAVNFRHFRRRMLLWIGMPALSAIVVVYAPHLDRRLDTIRFAPYDVAASFDTPYGHEVVLKRDRSLTLMTDNTLEATLPDIEAAENQLVPPLIYYKDARKVLYIGRAEFGVNNLARHFPGIEITAVDQRSQLDMVLDSLMPGSTPNARLVADPVAYLSHIVGAVTYDIMIINPGEPDNYRSSRLLTPEFLDLARRCLSNDGILFVPTRYDSERYVGQEKSRSLSAIYRTLQGSFSSVTVWPGTMTLFFASMKATLDVPYDSIAVRIDRMSWQPQYIHPDYLRDRLALQKTERVQTALDEFNVANRLDRPILTHYQLLYRSTIDSLDRRLIGIMLGGGRWLWALPIIILLLAGGWIRDRRRNRFPLFLYFTAGAVSLSLELISFYLFQASAGSLYSQMAALIGVFMLGLAAGTYAAHKTGGAPVEYPALVIMLVAVLLLLGMHHRIPVELLLYFHMLFLLTVALATGTLFVGATNRYFYGHHLFRNPGGGYAWELIGSALGALLTTTILLPLIGLTWHLVVLAGVIVLAFLGAMMTA
jgi:predicted membrane-bound spermidine synthase